MQMPRIIISQKFTKLLLFVTPRVPFKCGFIPRKRDAAPRHIFLALVSF